VVADMGDDGAEVPPCAAQGLTVDIPQPPTSATPKLGLLGKERLIDNPEQEVSVCPAGEPLTARFGTEEQGRQIRY
jgi:hypothetical protein